MSSLSTMTIDSYLFYFQRKKGFDEFLQLPFLDSEKKLK